MKNLICILLISLTTMIPCMTMQGQDTAQKHELGIRMSSLNNFGLIYKKHREEQKYLRFRLGYVNVSGEINQLTRTNPGELPFVNQRNSVNTAFGFNLGWENRKKITEELLFIHGFEPGLQMNVEYAGQAISGTSFYANAYLGYVLGFQYDFNEKISFSMESIPRVYAAILVFNQNQNIDPNTNNLLTNNVRQERFTLRTGASLNVNSIALNLVYKFSK